MSTKPQIELFLENESGTQQVAYPFVESDHVSLSNGMDIDTMIRQDVSMPTVTHEDLSFKVGVGDQNVLSAIVDSSVAEMTIKGQTYQNILPEPSTHVLTNNKEMFKVNEGLDPNVEIVDGVSKSAILTGNTLVNLLTKSNIKITNNGFNSIDYVYPLDNTKTYIIRYCVNQLPELSDTSDSARAFKFEWYHGGNAGGHKNIYTKYVTIGRNEYIKIEPYYDEISRNNLGIWCMNYASGTLDIDITILEYQDGMENWDIPYFTGMQSVKMPVLTTIGKNLFKLKTPDDTAGWGGANFSLLEDGFSFQAKSGWNSVGFNVGYPNQQVTVSATVLCSAISSNKLPNQKAGIGNVGYVVENRVNFVLGEEKRINSTFNLSNTGTVWFYGSSDREGAELGDEAVNWIIKDIQVELGSTSTTSTTYEPYKSNILRTPEEVVLRSLPNGVKDTLNLNTGEYVQRIGEITLNGSETNWSVTNQAGWESTPNTIAFGQSFTPRAKAYNASEISSVICDKFATITANGTWGAGGRDEAGVSINQNNRFDIRIERTKLSDESLTAFKQWLSQNPITVQYEFETPIVKTVDLSSSGNWEKIVFNGSENWNKFQIDSMLKHSQFYIRIEDKLAGSKVMCDIFIAGSRQTTDSGGELVAGDGGNGKNVWVNILNSRLASLDVNGFKQYLQQNPMTVWYQTETHKDSTQVKQPIFFKDGHVIQSSGADSSLIPTLDYQAKTSNSYVMDLMKANTRYTMKAKTASGTFTIDGTSYGAGTNGTFTTPSSMTNKLLVMSNKTNEEVMILEGDVVSKTIPYFKGIKSAFEDEDKIEVLSTGKNWVNLDNARLNSNHQKVVTRIENGFNIKFTYNEENFTGWDNAIKIKVNVKPNTDYTVSLTKIVRKNPYGGMSPQPNWVAGYTWVRKGDSNNDSFTERNLLDGAPTTMKFNSRDYDYVTLDICSTPARPVQDGDFDIVDIQIEESSSATVYESYKSNSTKIPLLSPLRSLPNGVCDEVIINREKKKATLIQRIGYDTINSEFAKNGAVWNNTKDTDPCFGFHCGNYVQGTVMTFNQNNTINDILPFGAMSTTGHPLIGYYKTNPHIAVNRNEACTLDMAKKWLDRNPINLYYQLETPIITEVDLEGFPYVYKDGHIFLNGEIIPVTEIKYSINQQHQIESSSQDLIRHQKEIDYLYKLIGEYVRVDYKNTLLSLNLELK